MGNGRISAAQHRSLPWRVHELLPDYAIEDVWALPVRLRSHDDLATFWEQMQLAIDELGPASLTGLLLRARMFVGRLFGWDRPDEEPPAATLRQRYLASAAEPADSEVDAPGSFSLVYALDDEYLVEIENKTVEAALHLGRVVDAEEHAAVNLAVYVKPRGTWGRLYMAAIRPFRHWIVYPTILRSVGQQWAKYVDATGSGE